MGNMFQHPPLRKNVCEQLLRAQEIRLMLTLYIIDPYEVGKEEKPHGKILPQKWTWKRNKKLYTLWIKWVFLEESSSSEEVDHYPKTCALFLQQWKQENMEAILTCIPNKPGWEQIQMHEETLETLDLNHNRWYQLQVNVGVLHLLCNSENLVLEII